MFSLLSDKNPLCFLFYSLLFTVAVVVDVLSATLGVFVSGYETLTCPKRRQHDRGIKSLLL